MSEVVQATWFQRNHFLIRRLHSLSGLVPVGVFLTLHLLTNSTIISGGRAFQTAVDQIHLLGKLGILEVAEIFGIFLPILFHAVVGVQIWYFSTPTAGTYAYPSNIRYTLQRITGGIAFVFILYHLWHMHWLGKPFGGGNFDPHDAARTAAAAMQASVFYAPLYAIGVVASVFHLSNGIWTALITWGVTVGPGAQRKAGWACAAFGVLLGAAGLSAVQGFRTFQPGDPPAIAGSSHAADENQVTQ